MRRVVFLLWLFASVAGLAQTRIKDLPAATNVTANTKMVLDDATYGIRSMTLNGLVTTLQGLGLGGTTGTNSLPIANNISQLLALPSGTTAASLSGYANAIDGAGGDVVYQAGVADGVLSYPSSTAGYVWKRVVTSPINAKWAGMVAGNSGAASANATALTTAIRVAQGDEIHFGPGEWFTTPINLSAVDATHVRFTGENQKGDKLTSTYTTRLTLAGGANADLLTIGNGVYATLENIALNGNKAGQSTALRGLAIIGTAYAPPHLRNVSVINNKGDGIFIGLSEVYLDYVQSGFNDGNGIVVSGGDVSGIKVETGFNGGDGVFFNGPTGGRWVELDSYINQGFCVRLLNANQLYVSGFHAEASRKACISIDGNSQGNRFLNGIIRVGNMQLDQNGSSTGNYPSGTWSLVEFTGTGVLAYNSFQNVLVSATHPLINFGTYLPKYFWEWKNSFLPAGYGTTIDSCYGFNTTGQSFTGLEFSPGFLDKASVVGNFTSQNGANSFDYKFGGLAKLDTTGLYLYTPTNQTTGVTYLGVDTASGKVVKAPTPSGGGGGAISPNAGNIITDAGNGLYANVDTATFDPNRFVVTPSGSNPTNWAVSWNALKTLVQGPITVTTNYPLMTLTQTWNNGTNGFTAALIDVTNTAADLNASSLFKVKYNGAEMFNVRNTGIISGHSVYAEASNSLGWGEYSGRTKMRSPVDGQVSFLNYNVDGNFDQIQFGGTTSSQPALAKVGANMMFRLADKSAPTGVYASTFGLTELASDPAASATNDLLYAKGGNVYIRQSTGAGGGIIGPLGTGGGGGGGIITNLTTVAPLTYSNATLSLGLPDSDSQLFLSSGTNWVKTLVYTPRFDTNVFASSTNSSYVDIGLTTPATNNMAFMSSGGGWGPVVVYTPRFATNHFTTATNTFPYVDIDITGVGTGDALVSNPLSQFAATTSAQLRGVVSDESGTGALLFAGGALGAATATTINKVTLTAPATGSTLTIDDGFTLHATGNVTALSGSHTGTSSGTNTGDQTSVTGNAGTATALQNARTINGTSFDGTANITVTAAADTLTGATLASGVTASSLTSFGSSPALTGTPTAPTASAGTSSTQIATTAFVANSYRHTLDKVRTATTVSNSVTETTFYTKTIAANTMGTDGGLHLTMRGTCFSNNGTPTFTVKVKFGGTVIYSDTTSSVSASANTRAWSINLDLVNYGSASAQRGGMDFRLSNSSLPDSGDAAGVSALSDASLTTPVQFISGTTNTGSNQDLVVTWTNSSTGAVSGTVEFATLELIP